VRPQTRGGTPSETLLQIRSYRNTERDFLFSPRQTQLTTVSPHKVQCEGNLGMDLIPGYKRVSGKPEYTPQAFEGAACLGWK